MKYGPSRGELIFRLVFSLAGLAGLAVTLVRPEWRGLVLSEIGVLALAFFGGTAIWTARQLMRGN